MLNFRSRHHLRFIFVVCFLLIGLTLPGTLLTFAQEETPTDIPTDTPIPTETAVVIPTDTPTEIPTAIPTDIPTEEPTLEPTSAPTEETIPETEITTTPEETPSDVPTETPSATPEETATVEPIIELPQAYSTNFDAGFPAELSSGGGWLPVTLDAGQAVQYTGGADAALYTVSTFTDSAVEAKILLNSGDVTLLLRKTAEGVYSAMLSSDGTLKLLKNAELINTGTVTLTAGVWVTLKLSAIGGVLSAQVDGAEMVSATDFAPLPSGQAGFAASPGAMVRLDDFAVYGTGDGVPVITPPEVTPEPTEDAACQGDIDPQLEECANPFPTPIASALSGGSSTLTATTNLPTQINLSWTPIANVDEYEVWRDSGNGSGSVQLGTTNAATTTYVDNFGGLNLLCSNTASYRVRGYIITGGITTDFTNAANGSTIPCAVPALTAPLGGAQVQSATLQWGSVANTNQYQVVITTNAAGTILAAGYPKIVNGTSHPVDPLPDSTYYWKVRAFSSTMNDYYGPFSAVRSFIIDTQPLTAQATPLTPVNNSTTNMERPKFTWTAVTGAAFYQIEVSSDPLFGTAEYTSPNPGTAGAITTATTFTIPPTAPALAQGVYYWHVRAFDTAQNAGAYSTLTPTFTVNLMNMPANNAVFTTTSSVPVTFTWAAVTGAFGYKVQVDINNNGTFNYKTCNPVPLTALTCTLSGVNAFLPGHYAWRVVITGQALLPTLPTRSFTVSVPLLPAPTLLSPSTTAIFSDNSPITRSALEFEWTSVPLADHYIFEIDNTPTFTTTPEVSFATSATPTVSNINLSAFPAGKYYWRVKTVNVSGVAGAAATSSFVIDLTPPALSPNQSTPANGAVINSVRPTFTYTAVTDPSTPVSYQVDISIDSGFGTVYTNANSTTTSATLSQNLPTQGIYYWRVTAYDRVSNSSTTGNIRSFTSNISNVPAVNAVVPPGNVTFSWATVQTATAYHLQIDSDGDGDFSSGAVSPPACSNVIPPVVSCVASLVVGTYPWRVVVDTPDILGNDAGNYRVVFVKTGAGLPAPTNVHLQGVTTSAPYQNDIYVNLEEKDNGINVVWDAPAVAPGLTVDHYIVEFSPTSAFATITDTQTSATTSLPVSTTMLNADGTNKYARVRAVYQPNSASSANTPSFWFVVDSAAPLAPTLISPAAGHSSKVGVKPVFTWTAVAGAAAANGYLLDLATNFNLTTPILPGYLNIPVTKTTFTAVELGIGSGFWRVRAVDVAGNISPDSPHGDFMVFLGTSPVQSAVNQAVRPTFTWQKPTGVTQYTLDVARDGDTSFTGDVYSTNITSSLPTISFAYPPAQPALSGIIYWRVYQQGTTPPAGYYASFAVTGGLSAPTLNPMGAGSVVDATEYPTAQLSWNAPSGIGAGVYNYHIEVASNAAFTGAVEIGFNSASNATSINLAPALDGQPDGLKYWRVRAEYMPGAILGPYSATGTFTLDKIPPLAPSNLTVNFGTNPSRPTLSWKAVTGIAASNGYQVDVSNDNFTSLLSGFPQFRTTPSFAFSSNLDQGTYQFRVRAIDAAGNVGPDSSPFSFVVNVANLPANNGVVNAPLGAVNQVFSWFAVNGASSYQVQVDSDGDFSTGTLTCSPATASGLNCTIVALSRGTYTWRVVVNGVTPPAEIKRTLFIINGTALPAPSLPGISEIGAAPPYLNDNLISADEKIGGVDVTWNTPTVIGATIVSYEVQFGTNASFTPLLDSVSNVVGLSTPVLATVVAADGVKYVRVRAIYAGNYGNVAGAFSAARTFTVDTAAPLKPTLTAPKGGVIVTTRTPTLTFAAATAMRYQVEVATSAGFGGTTIITTIVTAPKFTIPNAQGLANGGYFWRVTAMDAAGNESVLSDVASFAVNAP